MPISETIGAPHSRQAVRTSPPQSGQVAGILPALPAMYRRPQPHRRQKPQQSPSSRLRSYPMIRFLHTTVGHTIWEGR